MADVEIEVYDDEDDDESSYHEYPTVVYGDNFGVGEVLLTFFGIFIGVSALTIGASYAAVAYDESKQRKQVLTDLNTILKVAYKKKDFSAFTEFRLIELVGSIDPELNSILNTSPYAIELCRKASSCINTNYSNVVKIQYKRKLMANIKTISKMWYNLLLYCVQYAEHGNDHNRYKVSSYLLKVKTYLLNFDM